MCRNLNVAFLAIAATLCLAPVVLAQGASELLEGAWYCDVEGFKERAVFRLLEDETADMGWTENGKIADNKTVKGKWYFEDEDVNDKDQTVLTFIVQWDADGSNATTKKQIVVATLLTDDKMEVKWAAEPMRTWTRVIPDDRS